MRRKAIGTRREIALESGLSGLFFVPGSATRDPTAESTDPVIVEIECLATPPGTDDVPYKHIEAAIAVIQRSGLSYEVEALGTTIEGSPDQLWGVMREVHEACLAAGAKSVVTIIKAYQGANDTGASVATLTGKFRG